MTTVFINEATAAGKQILATLAAHPEAGSFEHAGKSAAPLDEHDPSIGTPWEVVQERLTRKLSEAYGVDFFKVTRMREAGLLKDKDVTNKLLLSPEFKYEPYPGFKPTPPQKLAHRKPEWHAAVKEMIAAMNEDEDACESAIENKYAKVEASVL
ncbi:MAG: hypothetical protein LBN98_03770 [Prevotellaceae bacterium]|jgi:hypothetical protein|nr:hypothetical protein [Prevotellaceae bacterium]